MIKQRIIFKFGVILPLLIVLIISSAHGQSTKKKHLFILSGQSNMVGLRPEESFLPDVAKAFGEKNIILVKDALGTQPIRRWYRDWKPLRGDDPKADPVLYDSLMKKVYAAIGKQKIATVTFIWMQGERDAREKLGEVYERSLLGLYSQISQDLKRKDVNFIIGRLSDFGLEKPGYPHWNMIREIQVKVGQSGPRFDWINTDDLNDGYARDSTIISNDIHMSAQGYRIMGNRFAEKAIYLIQLNSK